MKYEYAKASELKMPLTRERRDYAVMIALYFGNMSAQIDAVKQSVACDYDSFDVINMCTRLADGYDFVMCKEENDNEDEWLIDTERAREDAFKFAEGMIKLVVKGENHEDKSVGN